MGIGILAASSFGYLLLLFAVAYWAEKKSGKNLALQPYIYSFSIAVYCTAWAFYGSIGRAAENGLDFLAIYIGPTIAAPLIFLLLRRIIRICKVQRITSIADFISSRYGKSTALGTLATIVCILGLIPYIALQIKAIAITFDFLAHPVRESVGYSFAQVNFLKSTPFWITVFLAVFIIIFGTRKIDSSEKHEGMVTAVAFESIVKLMAFLAGGIFIVYFLFDGFADVFMQANAMAPLQQAFTLNENTGYADWFVMILLSALAVVLLPRQFQVAVVENISDKHLRKSLWIFPLYMLVLNFFVFPVALAGKIYFQNNPIAADYAILSLPFHNGREYLSLFVYIGGFSAATGMIIVETIALSTMLSNNLLLPIILKVNVLKKKFIESAESTVKFIRRLSIVLILLLAYAYFAEVAESYSLVSTGLISFAAVAQFAPAVLGAMFWRNANKNGAVAGIVGGIIIWFYTLIIPTIVGVGLLAPGILENGPFNIAVLKPHALLGLSELSPLSHAFFWSMLVNVFLYISVSVLTKTSKAEEIQAELFANVFKYHTSYEESVLRKGRAKFQDIKYLLEQFLGIEKTAQLIAVFNKNYQVSIVADGVYANQLFLSYSEKVLSGVLGAASARILMESVVKDEEITLNEVVEIIKESQQLISLNKQLQEKTRDLKKASDALAKVNRQMKEAEVLKDEFLYTITHELRTPLTSIRAFSEILFDNPSIEEAQRQEFLATMIKEIERLSRLITRVLDLEKLESGKQSLNLTNININNLIEEAISPLAPLINEKNVALKKDFSQSGWEITADKELLSRVIYNLVSNAIKYADMNGAVIDLLVNQQGNHLKISVQDNGFGIEDKHKVNVFSKFYQIQTHKKHEGSGLGLAICKKIIELHEGQIWIEDAAQGGARFVFTLPLNRAI